MKYHVLLLREEEDPVQLSVSSRQAGIITLNWIRRKFYDPSGETGQVRNRVVGYHPVQRHRRHERGVWGQRRDRGAASRGEMFKGETGREILGEERGERRYDAADRWDAGTSVGAQTASYAQVVVQIRTLDPVRSEERKDGHQAALLRPGVLQQIEVLPLEAFPPPKKTPVFKHIGRHGVQGPIISLAGVPRLPGHFDKAVV